MEKTQKYKSIEEFNKLHGKPLLYLFEELEETAKEKEAEE